MAELTDGTAELRVLVTTALGALPLENAIVSVSTVPDETGMRTLLYSVTTDSGGMTPSMVLTTPPRSNSLNPDSARRSRCTRSRFPPRATRRSPPCTSRCSPVCRPCCPWRSRRSRKTRASRRPI
ncbi:MAG: hypothetical protein ACLSV6_03555 [Butyricicoccus sp.]